MLQKKKPRFVLLLIILILTILSFCIEEKKSEIEFYNIDIEKQEEKIPEITLIYYYNPDCPFCRAINPYIYYLDDKFNVDYCNVKSPNNCSKDALMYMMLILNKTGGFAVPTIVLKEKNIVFQGFNSIAYGLEDFIEKEYNYSIRIFVGDKFYRPSQCYTCHIERKINMPKNFTCSNCCHAGTVS